MKKVLLYSRLAFYPMHIEAFKAIHSRCEIDPQIITTAYCDLPEAHKMLYDDASEEVDGSFNPTTYRLEQANSLKKTLLIWRELHRLKPDVIWLQEEPNASFSIPVLIYYFFTKKPLIVTALNENIFNMGSMRKKFFGILWKRLDGILSTTQVSLDGVYEAGMPRSIPAQTLVCGCLSPIGEIEAMPLPLRTSSEDFVIGFAGRICEEKGWKLLIETLRTLPRHFKLAVAGGGTQLEDLKRAMREPDLEGRIWYAGLLPKKDLWKFYKGLDCLAVPSLTTKLWKEQTGGVLQDAMAIGLPIIGSDSGGIPEIVGDTGLVVPENNAEKLIEAIQKLHADKELRKRLGENGKRRFKDIFSIDAYAARIAIGLGLSSNR